MRLLIIGKLDTQIGAAITIAKKHGASVTQAQDIEGSLIQLRSGKGADLIMVNVDYNIKALVDALAAEHIHIPIVGYGFQADSKKAVDAIKAGAKEYIPLPPDEELIAAVLEAITEESTSVIYSSQAMKDLLALAERVAPSNANILITGESGTGKEILARYLHKKSNRANAAFISVNCAAIPENLLESEMFGHEKGAFTGATHRRIGKFEEATDGTLLLDEISEMDIRLQAKLLRVIQEQEIQRVGGSETVKLNVRVIATSNRDLQKEAKEGRFREDLYFRLNVINLHVPPLREREDDIEPLAKHFIAKYAKANGLPVLSPSPEALIKLKAYSWPGNVREMENIMHRAVLLNNGNVLEAEAIYLPDAKEATAENGGGEGNTGLVGKTMENVERQLILETLDHCLGNRTHTANILGISIRTLRNKLKQYGEAEGDEQAHGT